MIYKYLVFPLLILGASVEAATDYTISQDNCVAWSEEVVSGDYSYSFTPAIVYNGGLQLSFSALNMKGKPQDEIDTIIKAEVNGKMVSFAVQGHGPTLIFRPQDKSDTMSILEAATTGSLAFNKIVFKTGGTKRIVNYLFAQCKE
ncbi:MAG: hypothetical protein ACRCYK_19705 [Aeromonas hydrophila]